MTHCPALAASSTRMIHWCRVYRVHALTGLALHAGAQPGPLQQPEPGAAARAPDGAAWLERCGPSCGRSVCPGHLGQPGEVPEACKQVSPGSFARSTKLELCAKDVWDYQASHAYVHESDQALEAGEGIVYGKSYAQTTDGGLISVSQAR